MNKEVKIMTITPEIARDMLDKNTHNRTLWTRDTARLAKEMINGTFKDNGDTIRIADDGLLLDGQHRLHACVASGVPIVDAIVVTLKDKSVFDTIDIGRRRTTGDVLSINGEKNAKNLAAALALLHRYRTAKLSTGADKVPPSELAALLDMNPNMRRSVDMAMSYLHKARIMPVSVLAFCHFALAEINQLDADTFIDQLMTGENLNRGEPALVLRNRLILESGKKYQSLRNYIVIAMVFKAWNAMRKNRSITVMKFVDGEEYPVPK